MKVGRALLSVSDKTGIVEFARFLSENNIELISSGGTASMLRENNITVKDVSEITEFPEILNGRVKTLHPKIAGGILAIRNNEEHVKQIGENKIPLIDLVVVNLYPFEKTISKNNAPLKEVIENIDIGGPSLIRAAAKNYNDVAVVVDPSQYQRVMEKLKENDFSLPEDFLKELSLKAFNKTAHYDVTISNYFQSLFGKEEFPENLLLSYKKKYDLRYGENNHQKASLYSELKNTPLSVPNMEQLHGKQLSYNNILDIDGALGLLTESFEKPTAIILKHVNPCGVACGDEISEAYLRALECDSTSAFGGVVGLNRKCDLETANRISEHFIEIVIAPSYSEDALEKIKEKKNIRIMEMNSETTEPSKENRLVSVHGGLLLQTPDLDVFNKDKLKSVTERDVTEEELKDLLFAWKVVRHVKSNSIVLAKDYQAVGIGAGQMSRVDASMLACYKAKEKAEGSVLASDAFFPFRDAVDEAARNGITAIIQPGGSIRDKEVIDAANENNIAMVFTGVRTFKH